MKTSRQLPSIALLLLCLGCSKPPAPGEKVEMTPNPGGKVVINMQAGSAFGGVCRALVAEFNQSARPLSNGAIPSATCEAQGSGELVAKTVDLIRRYRDKALERTAPELPTLLSLDGDIYHAQLAFEVHQLFPQKSHYVPMLADAPILASSPMVYITAAALEQGLKETPQLLKKLPTARTHQDVHPSAPPLDVRFVHAAPTLSNSGLQTLVMEFVDVTGKAPDQLTVEDVRAASGQVAQIEQRVVRYGASTDALTDSMVRFGPGWASLGSVYESSVIRANQRSSKTQPWQFKAVYPAQTFTSTMRAILLGGSWVSAEEKAAAEALISFLRAESTQRKIMEAGLRPGLSSVKLESPFVPELGVDPSAQFKTFWTPKPEVVAEMLTVWTQAARRASRVVFAIDSSASMAGEKLDNLKVGLREVLKRLGPRSTVKLIDYDSQIENSIWVDGTPEGQARGMAFIDSLTADGGSRVYDAILEAHRSIMKEYDSAATNGLVVLTDGEDAVSKIRLEGLLRALKGSGIRSAKWVPMVTIGYGPEDAYPAAVLEQLASLSGGRFIKSTPQSIVKDVTDMGLEF